MKIIINFANILALIFLSLVAQNAIAQSNTNANLIVGSDFCNRLRNSDEAWEIAYYIKKQVTKSDHVQYQLDTQDRLLEKFIKTKQQGFASKLPNQSFPKLDPKVERLLRDTFNQCLVDLYYGDSKDLFYLFVTSQRAYTDLQSDLLNDLEARKPKKIRSIDQSGNIVERTIQDYESRRFEGLCYNSLERMACRES